MSDSEAREQRSLSERPRAVVVGVQEDDVSDGDFESSLMELERLAKTLGLLPVGRVTQRRSGLAAASVIGEGKLKELADWTDIWRSLQFELPAAAAETRPQRRRAMDRGMTSSHDRARGLILGRESQTGGSCTDKGARERSCRSRVHYECR